MAMQAAPPAAAQISILPEEVLRVNIINLSAVGKEARLVSKAFRDAYDSVVGKLGILCDDALVEGSDGAETEGSDDVVAEGSGGAETEGSDDVVAEGSGGAETEGSDGAETEGNDGAETEGSDGTKTEGSDGAEGMPAVDQVAPQLRPLSFKALSRIDISFDRVNPRLSAAIERVRRSTHLMCLTHLSFCGQDDGVDGLVVGDIIADLLSDVSATHLANVRTLTFNIDSHVSVSWLVEALSSPLLRNLTCLDLNEFSSDPDVDEEELGGILGIALADNTNLTNLRELNLNRAGITEEGFQLMAQKLELAAHLTGLQQLIASDNEPCISLLALPNLSASLQSLDLCDTELTAPHMDQFCALVAGGGLAQLQELRLRQNPELGADSIARLCGTLLQAPQVQLTALDLSSTNMQELGASAVSGLLRGATQLSGLTELRVQDMQAGAVGIELLMSALAATTHISSLQVLDLGDNLLAEAGAGAVAAAIKAPHIASRLVELALDGVLLEDAAANALAEAFSNTQQGSALTSLQRLHLRQSTGTEQAGAKLASAVLGNTRLMQLKRLDLGNMHLHNMQALAALLPAATHLSRLEELQLDLNYFGDTGSAALGGALLASRHLTALHTIDITGTGVTDSGATVLRNTLMPVPRLLAAMKLWGRSLEQA